MRIKSFRCVPYFGISKPHWSQFNSLSSTPYIFAGWLTECLCVFECVFIQWALLLRLSTRHSDMWQNYKLKPIFFFLFFSFYHLRWIHNPYNRNRAKRQCLYTAAYGGLSVDWLRSDVGWSLVRRVHSPK